MSKYKEALMAELDDLEKRHAQLITFFSDDSGTVSGDNMDLVHQQHTIMDIYMDVLKQRIMYAELAED